jgi:hypothetical protein
MKNGDYDNNNLPFTSQRNIRQIYYIKFMMPSGQAINISY